MTPARRWALLLAGFGCLPCRAVSAAANGDAPPSLVWRAPPECIAAAELERAVATELGRPAFSAGAESELVVHGNIERTPSGSYRAEVRLDRASGEAVGVRSLTSDNRDCRSLDEALAVMLAIMLNVSRAEQPPERSPWSYRVALGGGATLGRMPGPGVELVLAGGPTLRDVLGFSLEVGLEWGPDESREEGSVGARALAARLALSPVLVRGNPELALHLAGGGGALEATAAGFSTVGQATRGFLELRAGPRLSVALSRALFFEIAGDFGLMPIRPVFMVENPDGSREELFEPSLVFGTLGLSLALRAAMSRTGEISETGGRNRRGPHIHGSDARARQHGESRNGLAAGARGRRSDARETHRQ